jgi:hypothetical protein
VLANLINVVRFPLLSLGDITGYVQDVGILPTDTFMQLVPYAMKKAVGKDTNLQNALASFSKKPRAAPEGLVFLHEGELDIEVVSTGACVSV